MFRHEREDICLTEKSYPELLDFIHRYEKLLRNKNFLNRLCDKGSKVQKTYDAAIAELSRRNKEQTLCLSLSKMSVNETKNKLDELEWTRKYNDSAEPMEDERNPLKIMATHSGTKISKQKYIDGEELVPSNEDINFDKYAIKICQRLENKSDKSKKFHTNKPIEKCSEVDDTTLVNHGKSKKKTVEVLSIHDVKAVHEKLNRKLKEIELERTIELLKTGSNIQMKRFDNNANDYRNGPEYDSSNDSDDEDAEMEANIESDGN